LGGYLVNHDLRVVPVLEDRVSKPADVELHLSFRRLNVFGLVRGRQRSVDVQSDSNLA
jgi:hypothetical protein